MSDENGGFQLRFMKRGPDVTTCVEPMKEYARVELRRSNDPTEQEVTKCSCLQNLPFTVVAKANSQSFPVDFAGCRFFMLWSHYLT